MTERVARPVLHVSNVEACRSFPYPNEPQTKPEGLVILDANADVTV